MLECTGSCTQFQPLHAISGWALLVTDGCCSCPAGTIGAKNQGKGIVGVAPGVGIYGIRVLRADGNGAFSDLVRTYDHLLKNGRALGIRVVNLSLSGSGTADDMECSYISQLIALGMTVVTAAGKL
jgi:hypothetical protein